MPENGKKEAVAQYESIKEFVERLDVNDDDVMDEIYENPLSVLVRSDWVEPGKKMEPYEYEILLSTGGPASRIIGTLNEHHEPDTAQLTHQDWFGVWEKYRDADEDVLLRYASCFFFGE